MKYVYTSSIQKSFLLHISAVRSQHTIRVDREFGCIIQLFITYRRRDWCIWFSAFCIQHTVIITIACCVQGLSKNNRIIWQRLWSIRVRPVVQVRGRGKGSARTEGERCTYPLFFNKYFSVPLKIFFLLWSDR